MTPFHSQEEPPWLGSAFGRTNTSVETIGWECVAYTIRRMVGLSRRVPRRRACLPWRLILRIPRGVVYEVAFAIVKGSRIHQGIDEPTFSSYLRVTSIEEFGGSLF